MLAIVSQEIGPEEQEKIFLDIRNLSYPTVFEGVIEIKTKSLSELQGKLTSLDVNISIILDFTETYQLSSMIS